ncbi:hypothetical protein MUO93_09430 [Candidatus Bathyarchaeota archaeon]|nr:hypothetical protein [Candidatus Bathyarchaeota archaeon]
MDLLEKCDVFRLVELLASECGLNDLAPGRGCFIEPPRLWDPEAEGFRILIDAEAFMDTSLEKAETFLGSLGLISRRTATRYGPFIEILQPRSRISCAHPPPAG